MSTITTNTPVVFTDDSSGGAPTVWSWDFGDGSPVVAQRNPTHVFERVGSYVVRLTATNARGSRSCSAARRSAMNGSSRRSWPTSARNRRT